KRVSGNGSRSDTRRYSRFSIGNDQFSTRGKVSKKDGRLNISVKDIANSGYLAKTLGAAIKHHLGTKSDAAEELESPTATQVKDERQRARSSSHPDGPSRLSTSSTADSPGPSP